MGCERWQWILCVPRRSVLAALTLAVATAADRSTSAEPPAAYRTWTDLTGDFRRDGRFLGFQDGRVRLEARDGKVVSIDFPKLSHGDRREALAAAGVPQKASELLQLVADRGTKAISGMVPEIGGDAGWLSYPEWLADEVWGKDEVVVLRDWPPGRREGTPARVLLKGANTEQVADGFAFKSERIWTVTGKRKYPTITGTERFILVAEPVELRRYLGQGEFNAKPVEKCPCPVRVTVIPQQAHFAGGHSGILQILGDRKMLVTMYAETDSRHPAMAPVLLRGVDTSKLTEDSDVPVGDYTVTGTHTYTSTSGARRAVFVVEPKGPAAGGKP
ncbi:MAG: SHD1 domain-containing protein [Thermoguttaceae bacterium]|jgi:hypothetical protein